MKFQKRHVKNAFNEIRSKGIAPNKESTKWDIIDPKSGERFPPKAILRIAKKLAQDTSYSGGGGPATNGPLKKLGFNIVKKPWIKALEVSEDIQEIKISGQSETSKERLIKARLGQGGFRKDLLEIWCHKCALTNCNIPQVLRASHIKPWRKCVSGEHLDSSNGILLAASIDALFDGFLITFTKDGLLKISDQLDNCEIEKLGIFKGQEVKFSSENQSYLEFHRSEFEKLHTDL